MSTNQPPVTPEQVLQQAINEIKNPTPLELRLDTGQVYRGNSQQELLDAVAKGQTEASRTITALKSQLEEQRTE